MLSSLLLLLIYDEAHFIHQCVVEEVSVPRDICQAVLTAIPPSGVLQTALRVSSSITTGHYVLNEDVDPKRLGSENNAMTEAQRAYT